MSNNFCVDGKKTGSVWGNLIDWETANSIAQTTNDEFFTNPDKCVRYEKNLYDWNGKVYVWLKNYSNGDNYFICLN
jgi:hypothetical protein